MAEKSCPLTDSMTLIDTDRYDHYLPVSDYVCGPNNRELKKFPILLEEVFSKFELGRKKTFCKRSYKKLIFFYLSLWPELIRAVGYSH